MALELDRIAVEEVGADPVRLARAIHKQLPELTGVVPVYDIARALDIDEVRQERLSSFEGCLLTDRQKSYGAILVNAASSRRRRRYTIGHELCHFLNERHVPIELDGFRCTTEDMACPVRSGQHLRQEREANTFAIELLAPERLIGKRLNRPADLEHALAIADDFEISREAAVRRYVAMHGECLAAVFSAGDTIRYIEKGERFPRMAVWAADRLPQSPAKAAHGSGLTTLDEVAVLPWLSHPDGVALFAQTLHQRDGYAVTMLVAEGEGEGEP